MTLSRRHRVGTAYFVFPKLAQMEFGEPQAPLANLLDATSHACYCPKTHSSSTTSPTTTCEGSSGWNPNTASLEAAVLEVLRLQLLLLGHWSQPARCRVSHPSNALHMAPVVELSMEWWLWVALLSPRDELLLRTSAHEGAALSSSGSLPVLRSAACPRGLKLPADPPWCVLWAANLQGLDSAWRKLIWMMKLGCHWHPFEPCPGPFPRAPSLLHGEPHQMLHILLESR